MNALLKHAAALSLLALPAAYGQDSTPRSLEFDVALSGAQEVPTVQTSAIGRFTIRFDPAMNQARYVLAYSDLTSQATAAHLHCAAAGENGPVVVPLQLPTTGVEERTFTNADVDPSAGAAETCGLVINNVASLFDAILQEKIYVNVHTETNPPGEIRSQLFSVQLSDEDDSQEDDGAVELGSNVR